VESRGAVTGASASVILAGCFVGRAVPQAAQAPIAGPHQTDAAMMT